MIKYCLDRWEKNKNKLEQFYRTTTGWNDCNYLDIVKAVVTHILNDSEYDDENWNANSITEIDNGDYQGTLLFLIPKNTYQPSEYEYLITYVGYGSCSGCDTLLAIQDDGEPYLTECQIKEFMTLSKDIIINIKKPYNCGWRNEEEFDEVNYED
jgi:hypothetical protein